MVETGASGIRKIDLGAVDQNIIPDIDNTRDLGSSAKQWATLFVVLALMGSLVVGGTVKLTTTTFGLIINDSTNIQGDLDIDNNLTALNITASEFYFGNGSKLTDIGSSSIDDIYLFNTGDTATGNYTFDTDTFFIDSSSNFIGIGTASPSAELHISSTTPNLFIDALEGTTSNLRWRDGTTQSWRISRFDGPDDLRIVADAADLNVMVFRTSGNVGIGTIAPNNTLDVIGNGSFTANLTLSDDLIMDQDDFINLGAGLVHYNGTCVIIEGSAATLEVC